MIVFLSTISCSNMINLSFLFFLVHLAKVVSVSLIFSKESTFGFIDFLYCFLFSILFISTLIFISFLLLDFCLVCSIFLFPLVVISKVVDLRSSLFFDVNPHSFPSYHSFCCIPWALLFGLRFHSYWNISQIPLGFLLRSTGFFKRVLFNFHKLVHFPVFFLRLIHNFILLWSEEIPSQIFLF